MFTLREKAIEAPNYRLIDVYDLEERMRGHLLAILLANEAGARMAADVLAENPKAGEMFVAAYVVAHRTGPAGLVRLIDDWDEGLTYVRSLTMALAWCQPDLLSSFMSTWIASTDLRLTTLALSVCAEHRVDPQHHLDLALKIDDARVRSAAFRCAGFCGRAGLRDDATAFAGENFEAAVAATLLGDSSAGPQALFAAIVKEPAGPNARRAAELAPLGMDQEAAQSHIQSLLSSAEAARWGIVAIGALGLPETLDWLVRQMEVDVLARVAAAAFGAISGADIKDPELEQDQFPEDPENPITEANVVEDFYESNLPWPDLDGVKAWLDENRNRFSLGQRHIMGSAAWSYSYPDMAGLKYQSAFRALSYEYAMRDPGVALPNWHAQVRLENGQFVRTW
ncbi:hypothetical protein [Yoonia sp. F2084L]|uniref:hypothetical protein n=1 Tax=Yoonia sp. F2084L TaxID=2926419 RepID=UPI001FF27B9B|nr:hypothetical protein [Yoonia sp. F2084L]